MEDLRYIAINFYYKVNEYYVSLTFNGLCNLENYTIEKDNELGEKFKNYVKNHYTSLLQDKIENIKITRISKKEYDEFSDDTDIDIVIEKIQDDELGRFIKTLN